MNEIRKRFLNMCGCEDAEQYDSLLQSACKRWNVSEKELEKSCRMIPEYYRTELKGIRKLIWLYVREWLHLEELEKNNTFCVYYNVPGPVSGMAWIRSALGENGYVGSPDLISMVVLYGIIGKAERVEKNGCRHCAVNMMRLHQIADGVIPAPNILWSNGLLCDEATKIDQLIRAKKPSMHSVFLQKAIKYGNQKEYMIDEIAEILTSLEEKYGWKLDCQEYYKIHMKRFMLALHIEQIISYLHRVKRFYIGNADIALLETLLLTTMMGGLEEMGQVADELYREIRGLISEEKEAAPVMDYRFAVYYTPECNPEYSKIFEKNGIGLLYQTAFKNHRIAAKKSERTPYGEIADECLGMLIGQSASDEGQAIADLIRERRLDGLVLGMFSFDRWLGSQQHMLQKQVEEITGKPVFVYETDFWNQESFAGERMSVAVETMKGMLEYL